MLTLFDKCLTHNCQGYSRRAFLRVGALGLGELALPQLLTAKAHALSTGQPYLRDKSVVLLFLQGGPPHIEFFDPKMTAPAEIRSITGEIQTSLPGITFGSTFPKLAARAHKISVLRSYASNNGGHTYNEVASGRNEMKAAMSAIYARVAGTNHPVNGMPMNVLIKPEAVQDGLKLGSNFETGALPTLTDAGMLGSAYAAFDPSGGGQLQQDMELRIQPQRLEDRRSLLSSLDTVRRNVDRFKLLDGMDKYRQQAFDVITGGIANAFDLSKEDPATVARYDTSHIFDQAELQRFYDMRRVTNLLGKQMLLARRLIEAGCGFVTVSDCGWDYHANNNSPKGMTGIWPMGHQVDHAVDAFLDDLENRGLSDKVLLAVTGEMGRTPRINGNGGRDHWGNLTALLLAGGGLKMGQVVGQSDRQAGSPATEKYTPENLLATVLNTLFDLGELRLVGGVPQEIKKITESGKPIVELV